MIPFPTPIAGAALCLALFPLSAFAQSDVDLEAGRKIFNETAVPNCAICHSLADAGAVGEIGPNMDEFKPTEAQVRAAVTSGIGVMPAFAETLTTDEIALVSAYVAAVTRPKDGTEASAASPEPAPQEVSASTGDAVAILAMGDVDAGEKAFRKCTACHTVDQGGANRVGPNLYGIVGAPVASADGFGYSDVMTEYGGDWSPARLDAFLASPRSEIPGTKMGFAGLKKDQDRADVVAYLNAQSDAPLPVN